MCGVLYLSGTARLLHLLYDIDFTRAKQYNACAFSIFYLTNKEAQAVYYTDKTR